MAEDGEGHEHQAALLDNVPQHRRHQDHSAPAVRYPSPPLLHRGHRGLVAISHSGSRRAAATAETACSPIEYANNRCDRYEPLSYLKFQWLRDTTDRYRIAAGSLRPLPDHCR